ncbi:hypothetical protein [Paracoccus benzoatiresistens]|uniref:Uncharacterized protein n=1 Tax=Paracoccus benzoatiresistens TaxID=2997341 RepID=A0ABT4JAG0_9RHOB|nr:hypothetical protein [Paracoccus sp. EF6]MCZ0963909.1 hypothetical protein [Paracoccus sp. EF6]
MNYSEQLRSVWKRYREEVSYDPVDLKTVASWAIAQGLWHPRPVDLSTSLANDLAQALREEKRVDAKGREYRANIPVRRRASDGMSLFEWADIDDAPRMHVEKSVQQERRSIASDCYALAMKVEHYNDLHPREEPLLLVLDFTDDVNEMRVARGLLDDDAA